MYAAMDYGFFAQHGLKVSQILGTSNPATEVISGAAPISAGTPTTAYIADAAGADIKAIYSPAANYESWLATPGITSPAQLKGKTIGVYSLQDLDVYYTEQMMSQFGVQPGSYTLLTVGPSNDKLAAMKAKSIAAAPLYPPTNFQAESDGLNQIYQTSQLKGGSLPTLYVVSSSWAQAHRSEVVNYLEALDEAHKWVFEPQNKAKVIGLLEKYTQLPANLAEKSYDLFFTHPGVNYSIAGEWNAATVQAVEPTLLKLKLISKPVPYSDTVDLSYMQAAKAGTS